MTFKAASIAFGFALALAAPLATAQPSADTRPPLNAADSARVAKAKAEMSKWVSSSLLDRKGPRPISTLISAKDCVWLKLSVEWANGCPSSLKCVNHAANASACID